MKALIILALFGACADHEDPLAAALPCRDDCARTEVTCSNACLDAQSPGDCRIACAANELSCQQVCEARYPADDSIRCKADCSRFGGTCRNNCSDEACSMACTSKEQSCNLQCDGQYGN